MNRKKQHEHPEERKEKQDEQGNEGQDEGQEEEQSHRGETEHDLIEYDPEKAQELIDVEEATDQASQVHEPHLDNPQRPKQGVPPRQENTSSGFTTGGGMQGGSAKRRKR